MIRSKSLSTILFISVIIVIKLFVNCSSAIANIPNDEENVFRSYEKSNLLPNCENQNDDRDVG